LGRTDVCGKPPDQARPTLRASAVAVPPEHWFVRASNASPWWLGLPALAAYSSLPRPVRLRCSQPQSLRQAGRSDLCSCCQQGSAGHSACFVIRVTQLCQISQDYRQLAQDAELVALATTHTPSYLYTNDEHCMDAAGAGPCWHGCVSVKSQVSVSNGPLPMQLSRAVRVQLCVFRRHAERPGRPCSCRQVRRWTV
jgi:hypothetical protein